MTEFKTYRFWEIRRPYGLVVGIGLLTAAVIVLFELVNMAVLYRHVRLDLYLCLVAVFFLGAGALLTRRWGGRQTHGVDVPVMLDTVVPEQPAVAGPEAAQVIGEQSETEEKSMGTSAGLIELLSAKEWQILKLVAEGKTNKEIAAVQFVEVSTVKTHLNNIYGKLSVSNRKEARAKYAELAPSWPIIR